MKKPFVSAAAKHAYAIEEYRKVCAELERRGIRPPEPFEAFVKRHNPTLLKYEHVPRVVDVLNRMLHGELTNVLMIEPPRYFKTEVASRLFTAAWLRQRPWQHVGLTSYGAELAWSISEEARNYFRADGGEINTSTDAKKRWRTMREGEMWAAGVGGPLLGFGWHLGIVDDPTDPEKAASPRYQQRFIDWYPSKFLSRQEPGAKQLFIMQRLGLQDPIDFLFRREVGEKTPKAPMRWHVVFMDEIKSDEPIWRGTGPMGLPDTCTLEPDPRRTGAVLAPSRFSKDEVRRLQEQAGPFVASTQRQGRPMRPTGDFWKQKWFRIYDEAPKDMFNVGRDWDLAYGEDDANAASAYVRSGRGPADREGRFNVYIEDVSWDWLEFPELVEWMQDLAGPHYIEAKASGKSARQSLTRSGVSASEVNIKGSKLARASAAQPFVSNGRVYVKRDVYDDLMFGERQGLMRITAQQLAADEGYLDVNDVFVQAITRHVGLADGKTSFWMR